MKWFSIFKLCYIIPSLTFKVSDIAETEREGVCGWLKGKDKFSA